MAKYSNVVEYNIVTDVDSSGIVKLQNELTKLKQSLKFDKGSFNQLGFDDAKIDKSIRKVNQLQAAITAAFNPKIGTIDLGKLNASLQKEHTSLQMIVKDWEQMGTRGTMAISNLSNALLSMNKGAMTVNTTLSKIANTFSNTVRWGITASIFQEMMSSVQGAVSYMKDLDESLTNIQMVTNSSKEDMRELARYANQAAQALGSTTTDYTNAVKVFVQEGFSERESKQYANLSTKLANVSEQNTATTSDQITAYRNAFGLSYEETVKAMDKVANVANNTASNVNELMTASQRAASVAQAVGSSQESFLAAIATIESVTRQSAEEIGNGLKTIYQRFADIKVSGKTEDGVEYGQYAQALKSVGVDVLDVTGNFKGFDQILTELQDVWGNLSETMKIAVGEKVAGKFQYNRFAALMNNREYYEKSYAATQNAGGMMDQMNEIYMQGIEGRLNTLQAAGEQVMSTLFNQDDIEPVLEQATNLLNVLNDMVEAAGGLSGVVQALGAIMLRTFSTQIAGTISNIATSISTVAANSRNANQLSTSASLLGLKNYGQSENQNSIAGQLVAGVADNYDKLSTQTQEKIRDLSSQIVELEEQKRNIYIDQEKILEDIHIQSKEELRLAEEELQLKEEEISAILQEAEANDTLTNEQKNQLEALNQQVWVLEDNVKLYNEITNSCAEYTKKLAEGKQLTTEEVNQLKAWRDQTIQLNFHIAELDSLLEQVGIATNSLNIAGKIKDTITQTAAFEAKINSVVKTLSNVTSIAFGFSMISSMFKTLADDSATLEDKLNAVIMNGLMGITMLLPSLTALTAQIKSHTVALIAEALAEKESYIARLMSTISIRQRIAMLKIAIGQLWVNIAALKAHTIELIKNKVAMIAALPLPAKIAIAVGALTIALLAGAKAYLDNASALAQANKEYEHQKEILDETKQHYQDTSEQVEQLKASLDKIGESRKVLDDLTEGTDEWRAAVVKLNQEVLALLQIYPELAKYVTNVNGILTLDNEGMQAFTDKQMQKLSNLNDAQSIQQISTLNAKNNQLVEQFASNNNISVDAVKAALDNGAVKIEDREDLTAAFAQLSATIMSNNAAIQTLTGSIGILNTSYTNYATNDVNVGAAMDTVKSKWGITDEYGNNIGYNYNDLAKNEDFRSAISSALGEAVNTISFKDNNFTLNTQSGTMEYTADALMQLAGTGEILNQQFQENATIYKEFGATYNQVTGTFENAAGETIKSLDDLHISSDKLAALDAYREGIYNKIADQDFEGTVVDFVKALADGTINVDGFSDKLNKASVDLINLINNKQYSGEGIQEELNIDENQYNMLKQQYTSTTGFNDSDLAKQKTSFEETKKAAEDYQEQIKKAQKTLQDSNKTNALTNAALNQLQKGLDNTTDEIAKQDKKLQEHEKLVDTLAARYIESSKGLEDLVQNFDKLSESFQSSDPTEQASGFSGLATALGQIMNIDPSNFNGQFIAENLSLIGQAAAGSSEALSELRRNAAEDIILANIQLDPNYSDAVSQAVQNALDTAQAICDADWIQAGATLDPSPFLAGLEAMEAAGLATKENISSYFDAIASMGVNFYFENGARESIAAVVKNSFQNVDTSSIAGAVKSAVQGAANIAGEIQVQLKNIKAVKVGNSGSGFMGNHTSPSTGNGKNGGGSTKSRDKKDSIKKEWDYLTDITHDLDRMAASIEKLNKLTDRLYGKNRTDQLKKIREATRTNIKLLRDEANQVDKNLKKMRQNNKNNNKNVDANGNYSVTYYARKVGIKLKYDKKKENIENGEAIEKALVKKVNNAITAYNNLGDNASDAKVKKAEKAIETAQNNLAGFREAYAYYHEQLSLSEDIKNNIIDEKQKIQDMQDQIVDAIQEGVEDMVKAIDNQRDYNKLRREWFGGGSGYSHFKSDRQYYTEGLTGLFSLKNENKQNLFDQQKEALTKDISYAEEAFGKNAKHNETYLSQEAAQKNLTESVSNILDSLTKMTEYYDGLLEGINDASSKMDELIDMQVDQFDRILDVLDSRLDQIKLLMGDKDYETQTRFYNQKIATNIEKMATIAAAIEAKQATVKELEKLEVENTELSNEDRAVLIEARNKVNELQQEQIDTETNLLEDIASKLESETSAAMRDMVNSMFGSSDTDWLSQQWEVATRNSSQYLDDYNRAFETEKLQLKYQQLLNNTQQTSFAIQQRIAAQMTQQLKFLRDKNELSEYDVQYAQKQLDILQKQIALEEAQNAKSQMRLQRNAAGNYEFVYAANKDAVNKANEELINAQQEAYNMSKQQYTQTYESALQAATETKEMVVSIATDASLSVEERTERIQFILDNLNEYMSGSSEDLKNISVNLYNDFIQAENAISQANLGQMAAIYDEIRAESKEVTAVLTQDIVNTGNAWAAFGNNASGALVKIKNVADINIPGVSKLVSDTLGKIDSQFIVITKNMLAVPDNIKTAVVKAQTEINKYLDTYQAQVILTLHKAGDTYGELKEKIDGMVSSTDNVVTATKKLQNLLTSEDIKTIYDNLIDNGIDAAATATKTLATNTDTFKNSLTQLNTIIAENAKAMKDWKTPIDEAIISVGNLIKKATELQGAMQGVNTNPLNKDTTTDNNSNTNTNNNNSNTNNNNTNNNNNNGGGASTTKTTTTTSTPKVVDITPGTDINTKVTETHTNTQVAQGIANAILNGNSGWGSTSKKQTTNITHVYNKAVADEVAKLVSAKTTTKDVKAITYSSKTKKSSTGHAYKNNSTLSERIASAILQGNKKNDYNGWGSGKTRTTRITDRYGKDVAWTVEELIKAADTKAKKAKLTKLTALKYVKDGAFTFATGGYTGIWSTPGVDSQGGKWAVLHQKELVLNQDDTKNMLSAVNVVRDIVSNINSLSSIGKIISPNNVGDTIQQRVEITANFPGVNEAIQIKQALEQLADNAYQVASKYKY